MNHLIIIGCGWPGYATVCYLNLSREIAIQRFEREQGYAPTDGMIQELTFRDRFESYFGFPNT